MTQPIALPTIHPGGTDPIDLFSGYSLFKGRIREAKKQLAKAPCDSVDFPDDPGAFQQAQADRREMLRLLEVLTDYASRWEAPALDAITEREAIEAQARADDQRRDFPPLCADLVVEPVMPSADHLRG